MLTYNNCLPADVRGINEFIVLWEQDPPILFRKAARYFFFFKFNKGRNRQIRRLTVAARFPTERLIGHSVKN